MEDTESSKAALNKVHKVFPFLSCLLPFLSQRNLCSFVSLCLIKNSVTLCLCVLNRINYGIGSRPSHFTSQSFGNPGVGELHPSHPAHIIATAVSKPPFPGI